MLPKPQSKIRLKWSKCLSKEFWLTKPQKGHATQTIQSWSPPTLQFSSKTPMISRMSNYHNMLKMPRVGFKKVSYLESRAVSLTLQSTPQLVAADLWSNREEHPTCRRGKNSKLNLTPLERFTRERTNSYPGQQRVSIKNLMPSSLSSLIECQRQLNAWIFQKPSSEEASSLTRSKCRKSNKMKRK